MKRTKGLQWLLISLRNESWQSSWSGLDGPSFYGSNLASYNSCTCYLHSSQARAALLLSVPLTSQAHCPSSLSASLESTSSRRPWSLSPYLLHVTFTMSPSLIIPSKITVSTLHFSASLFSIALITI